MRIKFSYDIVREIHLTILSKLEETHIVTWKFNEYELLNEFLSQELSAEEFIISLLEVDFDIYNIDINDFKELIEFLNGNN